MENSISCSHFSSHHFAPTAFPSFSARVLWFIKKQKKKKGKLTGRGGTRMVFKAITILIRLSALLRHEILLWLSIDCSTYLPTAEFADQVPHAKFYIKFRIFEPHACSPAVA